MDRSGREKVGKKGSKKGSKTGFLGVVKNVKNSALFLTPFFSVFDVFEHFA